MQNIWLKITVLQNKYKNHYFESIEYLRTKIISGIKLPPSIGTWQSSSSAVLIRFHECSCCLQHCQKSYNLFSLVRKQNQLNIYFPISKFLSFCQYVFETVNYVNSDNLLKLIISIILVIKSS